MHIPLIQIGLPLWLSWFKESTCNAEDLGSNPGMGRSPGEGKGYPLQYSADNILHSFSMTYHWGKLDEGHTTACETALSQNYSVLLWILQARIMEWVAFPFSRGSSQPRDRTQISCIAGGFFTSWATREAQEYWRLGSLSLLQGIFPPQELNWDLLHCRWILYQLSY